MAFAVEDALDDLYSARPEEFTALRTKLAARARSAGDAEAAKRISGSRKPTTAAWVVNALARSGNAKSALSELGSQLRDAHAAMDGEAIRTLTAQQRRLVDDLARAGLRDTGLAEPSAALRDDVTSTLQAAVADPDVAARLGRLTKAEQWSGFGDFGFTAAVSTVKKGKKDTEARKDTEAKKDTEAEKDTEAKKDSRAEKAEPAEKAAGRSVGTGRRVNPALQQARAALAAAQRAKAEADGALDELQADLATARLRHQDARRRLTDAEAALTAAEDAYESAKQSSRDAGDAVKAARRQVREAGD